MARPDDGPAVVRELEPVDDAADETEGEDGVHPPGTIVALPMPFTSVFDSTVKNVRSGGVDADLLA